MTLMSDQKKLNTEYHKKIDKLLKRQHKQSKQFTQKLKKKEKTERRKLNKEQKAELRMIKRHEGKLGESTHWDPDSQHNLEVIDVLSASRRSSDVTAVARGDLAQGNEQNNDGISNEGERIPKRPLDRLRQEMEEKMAYLQSTSNLEIANLEWKFLQERQNLKREFVELTAEFKQHRLISLSQLKKNQLRGYYEIHRKRLSDQHTRELDSRQRACQETLKRLTSAQTVERHTACRLAETTAKGQREMSRILNTIESTVENGLKERPVGSVSTQDLYTPGSDNTGEAVRCVAVDTTLIDGLFPNTCESPQDASPRQKMAVHQRSNYSLHVSDAQRELGSSCVVPSDREGVTSLPGFRVPGSRQLRSRYEPGRQGLRHAKSTQSLQPTLMTCGDVQRSLINSISRQHLDQWAEVMSRERGLTDVLIQTQASQKEGLLTEESATLKRTELEQNYRMAHLAIYLEAREKFMEKEFAEERTRMMEYYFKKKSDDSQSDNRTLPFAFLQEYNCAHLDDRDPSEDRSATPNSMDTTESRRKMDIGVETSDYDFQVAHSVNRTD